MSKKTLRIGVDAGASGGIVWQVDNGPVHMEKIARMSTPLDEQIKGICKNGLKIIVYIETVGTWTGDNPAIAPAIQKLRDQWTHLRIYFKQNGGQIIDVPPATWQRAFHLVNKRPKNMSKSEEAEYKKDKKNRHKECAQAYFKNHKIYHWNSDASLILVWGKNQRPEG